MRRRYLVTGIGVAVLSGSVLGGLTLGGVTFASPTTSTYTACVTHVGGALYNVTATATPKCFPHDQTITWNQQGPTGTPGPQGPQGPQGKAGLTWKGDWSPSTTYGKGAVVNYTGSAYVSTAWKNASSPATTGHWALLAAKGVKGTTGPQGPKGTSGPQGPQGTRGAAGPEYVAQGLVKPTGGIWSDATSPGVTVTVTDTGPGKYHITVNGLGTGVCPGPSLTPYGGSFTLYFSGGNCGPGWTSSYVFTSSGTTQWWEFLYVGTGTATNGGTPSNTPQIGAAAPQIGGRAASLTRPLG